MTPELLALCQQQKTLLLLGWNGICALKSILDVSNKQHSQEVKQSGFSLKIIFHTLTS